MQTFCVRFPFRGFFISKNFYLSDNPMEFREILVTAFCQRLNAKSFHPAGTLTQWHKYFHDSL